MTHGKVSEVRGGIVHPWRSFRASGRGERQSPAPRRRLRPSPRRWPRDSEANKRDWQAAPSRRLKCGCSSRRKGDVPCAVLLSWYFALSRFQASPRRRLKESLFRALTLIRPVETTSSPAASRWCRSKRQKAHFVSGPKESATIQRSRFCCC